MYKFTSAAAIAPLHHRILNGKNKIEEKKNAEALREKQNTKHTSHETKTKRKEKKCNGMESRKCVYMYLYSIIEQSVPRMYEIIRQMTRRLDSTKINDQNLFVWKVRSACACAVSLCLAFQSECVWPCECISCVCIAYGFSARTHTHTHVRRRCVCVCFSFGLC